MLGDTALYILYYIFIYFIYIFKNFMEVNIIVGYFQNTK